MSNHLIIVSSMRVYVPSAQCKYLNPIHGKCVEICPLNLFFYSQTTGAPTKETLRKSGLKSAINE
jgi:hypothetical protein